MSVIEELDSVLAKWRDRARRNAVWSRYGGEEMVNCADDLDALMPAIRQNMIDARRYRVLRAGLLNEDWTLIEKLSKACPEPRNEAEFDAAIDAATGEGEGHD